jgi:hypothetical protein
MRAARVRGHYDAVVSSLLEEERQFRNTPCPNCQFWIDVVTDY